MPEENSKIMIAVITVSCLVLAVYVCAVVVAFGEEISVTTVIHNWYDGLIDFVKELFV
jgi:hypothetical protein